MENVPAGQLPEEERVESLEESAYERHIQRLSHQSVVKHFECYRDIPWDDPEYAIDPEDPRFALSDEAGLGATSWYREQPEAIRARIGCHMMATFMQTGWIFENVLKQGLLRFALRLPQGAPEFRYAYHEIIEEAQHGMMFREFVGRTGLEVPIPKILFLGERIAPFEARRFPELFFLAVLAGEDPIDWQQRKELRCGRELHPLVERITRIHILEEARHVSFARHYLRRRVPNLSAPRRLHLKIRVPLIFKQAGALMTSPSPHIIRTYRIPSAVVREAYGPGSSGERAAKEALTKPRDLCRELGILDDTWSGWWRLLGIEQPAPA